MKWFEKIRERRMELGLSQAELAQKVRVSQASIDKIERGLVERPRKLPDLVAVLGIDPKDIEAGGAEWFSFVAPATVLDPAHEAPGGSMPVFAEDGEFYALPPPASSAIEFIPTPHILSSSPEAYGLMVVRDEMSPAFEEGDVVLVNPRLPILRATDVVLYVKSNGQQWHYPAIARFEKGDLDSYHFLNWNPEGHSRPSDGFRYHLPRAHVAAMHRIVGKYSRR
ncbi:MAG: helix-turn-helix transcriptional regulator [Chelatococcus sp.]|nr:helix-turn-helix transcriptional regulator [Chelatococcus sp.]